MLYVEQKNFSNFLDMISFVKKTLIQLYGIRKFDVQCLFTYPDRFGQKKIRKNFNSKQKKSFKKFHNFLNSMSFLLKNVEKL